jgi:hypothetical protein
MFSTSIISHILVTTTLAGAPLARAEVQHEADSAHLLAYDENQDLAAEIVVSYVGKDHIRIEASFPDAVYLDFEVIGDEVMTLSSGRPAEAAARIAELGELLTQQANDVQANAAQEGWLECAGYTALAAGACASGSIIACAAATILAACTCLEAAEEGECT